MSIINRNFLKSWYVTLAKPLQEQYWHWLDSYWHKNDPLPISTITDLQSVLNDIYQKIDTINNYLDSRIISDSINQNTDVLLNGGLVRGIVLTSRGGDMTVTIGINEETEPVEISLTDNISHWHRIDQFLDTDEFIRINGGFAHTLDYIIYLQ